jgi:predicted secreted protein
MGVSAQAQRLALAVLEVLGGLQKPSEVAKSLGLSLNRYYQVEIRAVRGLLRACEPVVAIGRPPTATLAQAEKQAARLAAENRDLKQEVSRAMALVRAARRTIGLVVPAAVTPVTTNSKGGKSRKAGGTTTKDGEPPPVQRRRSKPRVRALHTVVRLRANAAAVDAPISTAASSPVIAAPDRPGG